MAEQETKVSQLELIHRVWLRLWWSVHGSPRCIRDCFFFWWSCTLVQWYFSTPIQCCYTSPQRQTSFFKFVLFQTVLHNFPFIDLEQLTLSSTLLNLKTQTRNFDLRNSLFQNTTVVGLSSVAFQIIAVLKLQAQSTTLHGSWERNFWKILSE